MENILIKMKKQDIETDEDYEVWLDEQRERDLLEQFNENEDY